MTKSTRVFSIFSLILLAILLVSLFYLQVIRGEYYQQVAESNIFRIRRVFATRGEIYDNKYRPIVQNIPSHDLYLTTNKIGDLNALARFLFLHLQIEEKELMEIVQKQRFKTYEEILIADNIDYEKVLSLSEYLNYYPELTFRIGSTRDYLYPNHFSGYVGRINEEEYEKYYREDYSLNGYIGKTGLERYYEVLLRGKDGKEIVQVDSRGRSLGFFSQEEGYLKALNGLSLVLTIDNDLQNFCDKVFPSHLKGALVVSDIRTGGILAYVSKPDYDPNIFMQRISPEVWKELNHKNKPMLDRVIHATYPPGSVFKPLTAGCGMEKGLVNRNTRFSSCGGGFKYGNRYFKCWLHSGHGITNVIQALTQSCDVFFYELSLKLSLDEFKDYAVRSGFYGKTGIDLPNERRGFFPDTEWYKKKYGPSIGISGHKVNLSIGQGEILTSPIQMNAYYAALANKGQWIQPHLLKQTVGRSRLTASEVQPLKKMKLPLSDKDMALILEGLYSVCNAPNGTARVVQVPGAKTFGKTGSAENSMGKTTHAWFCGHIETDKPEIAVTVFMENAGGGGSIAAPVAKQVFDYYIGNIEDIKRTVAIPAQFRTAEDEEEALDEEFIPFDELEIEESLSEEEGEE
jgi:penicillin-binding protein 2